MNYSPLRYPGGKQRLANFFARVCEINDITGHYIEPYAGGAAIALTLLIEGKVSQVTINDKDRSIYAFWYCVLNKTEELCTLIRSTRVTLDNWRIQKEIQKRKTSAGLLELGFSTFFLNRTNRSGIITGGVIGGAKQKGEYRIKCRFNKKNLLKRIRRIAEFKENISLFNMDAIDLIKTINNVSDKDKKIFYFDPPYYIKGESLYLNSYLPADHKKVSRSIKSISKNHWIVTYDNTLPIKALYNNYRSKQYILRHIANEMKSGKEIMFLSKNLVIPKMIFNPR